MTMLDLVSQHFILYCRSQLVHPSWQCWPWEVNILSSYVTISPSFMTMLVLVSQHFILLCRNQSILHDNAGPGKSTFYPLLSQLVHPSWQCWPWEVKILSSIVTINPSSMTMSAVVSQHFIHYFHNQSILHGHAGPFKSTFYPPLSQSVHPSWQCWT